MPNKVSDSAKSTDLKYMLYEASVQTPEIHVEMYSKIHREVQGKDALILREDFCGTFLVSCTWVKQSTHHKAICLDLDLEPLEYGRRKNLSRLAKDQQKRVKPLRSDVLIPTELKSDLIVVGNFSFFIFKDRPTLLRYFRSCLNSLAQRGTVVLEMAGGPGMIYESKEQKTVTYKSGKTKKKFVYVWDQKYFDPISHDAEYSIHFKIPGKKPMRHAFTYDWRLWTIPEVRELLHEAGFSKTVVYWETAHKGEGTGEYVPYNKGADNAFAWIAYVVGVK